MSYVSLPPLHPIPYGNGCMPTCIQYPHYTHCPGCDTLPTHAWPGWQHYPYGIYPSCMSARAMVDGSATREAGLQAACRPGPGASGLPVGTEKQHTVDGKMHSTMDSERMKNVTKPPFDWDIDFVKFAADRIPASSDRMIKLSESGAESIARSLKIKTLQDFVDRMTENATMVLEAIPIEFLDFYAELRRMADYFIKVKKNSSSAAHHRDPGAHAPPRSGVEN